jgi:hypothetical protein
MVDSQVIQCPLCGEYRHKSWFNVGWRGCLACYEAGRVWQPALDSRRRKLDASEKQQVKAVIYDWMTNDSFPEEITAQERKLLQLRTLDMKSLDETAKVLGIKLKRAAHIEQQAQSKLHRLAKAAMPGWVAARN